MDAAILLFVVLPLLVAIVFGPLVGAEDRPAFRWPDKKPRRNV